MKKIVIAAAAIGTLAVAGQMRYGYGTFGLKGGFLGLDSSQSTHISSYSLVEQHKNLLASKWYYTYNVTWYDSSDLDTAQKRVQIDPRVASGSGGSEIDVPAMKYRFQGLDAQASLGYDVYHEKRGGYVGIGMLLGLSAPWIDSQKSDQSKNDPNYNGLYEKSGTRILTFRVGPSIEGKRFINDYISLYGSAGVAYQDGRIKNGYAHLDSDVDGWFGALDAGIRFDATHYDKKIFGIAISPRLYAALGYRYSYWKLNDVAVDTSGQGIDVDKSDLRMRTSEGYIAVGYSF